MVSISVNWTSFTEARIVVVRSLSTSRWIAGGTEALQARQLRIDAVDDLDDVGAGLLEDDQEDAALAVRPGGLLGVLRARHGLADVADADRAAVAVGDDDVVPVLARGELVVGVDREALLLAVDAALRAVDGRDHWRWRTDVLQRQALGHELGRDRSARGSEGFCSPPMDTCDTPEIWLICCAILVSALSSTSVSGSVSEVAPMDHDRAVGRIDLSVGRRARQVLGQLAAGSVDGRLHVVGGPVDVAVEVELQRDAGRARA